MRVEGGGRKNGGQRRRRKEIGVGPRGEKWGMQGGNGIRGKGGGETGREWEGGRACRCSEMEDRERRKSVEGGR